MKQQQKWKTHLMGMEWTIKCTVDRQKKKYGKNGKWKMNKQINCSQVKQMQLIDYIRNI